MSNTLFKKVTASVAALSVVLSIVSPVTGVKAADAGVEAANRLASLGVIVDSSSNPSAYNLGSSITRREMLKVMMNLSSVEVTDKCEGKFSDLPATDWGCKYAEAALNAGFIAANPKFRPNDLVTEAEALKMIMQARGVAKAEGVSDWAEAYRQGAVAAGILAEGTKISTTTSAKRSMVFVSADSAVTSTTSDDTTSDDSDVNLDDLFGDLFDEDGTDANTDETTDEDTTNEDTTSGTTSNVKAGDLEVSLSPETPAADDLPKTAEGVAVASFDLTAGDEDISVSSVKLARKGLGASAAVSDVALFADGSRVSKAKTFNSSDDTAEVVLSPALVVKAGETVVLTAKVNTKNATGKFAVELTSLVSSAANVDGEGILANYFEVKDTTATKITPSNDGSVTSPKLGTMQAEVLKFKIKNETSTNEDVTLNEITLKEDGSIDENTELANVALYYNGSKVADGVSNGTKYFTFTLNDGILIKDGKTEKFVVKADIVGGAGDTINFTLDNDLDVSATASKYGYVSINGTSAGSLSTTALNVQAGEVTLVQVDPTNTEVRKDKDDVVLGTIKVVSKAGKSLELENFRTSIQNTGNASNISALLENIELYDQTNGSVYDLVRSGAAGTTEAWGEEVNITVPSSGELVLVVRADTLNDNAVNTAKFIASVSYDTTTTSTAGNFAIKETADDKYVTDVTPSSITFKTVNGTSSSLSLNTVALSSTKSAVIGSKGVEGIIFELKSNNDSSDLTVDEIKVKGTVYDNASSATITVATPDVLAGGENPNSGDIVITRADTTTDTISVDIAAGATANAIATAIASAIDADADYAASANGAVVTVVGPVNSIDSSDLQTEIVNAGAAGATLTAAYSNNGTDSVISNSRVNAVYLYNGTTLLDQVSGSNLGSDGIATFDGFKVKIAKNSSQRFTVTTDLLDAATNANDEVKFAVAGYSVDDEDSDPVYVSQDTDSDGDLTDDGVVSSPRTITIKGAGSLSLIVDNTDTETDKAKNILAGSTSPFVASYELTATNEGVLVKDFTIAETSGSTFANAVSEIVVYANDKTTELARKTVTGESVSFTNVNFVVEEGSENVYVKVVTSKIGKDQAGSQTANLALTLQVTKAEGASSNKTVTNPSTSSDSNTFSVLPTRISNVTFVDSASGISRATKLNNGVNNVAIIAVTTDSSTNTNVSGGTLKTNLKQVKLNVSKLTSANGTAISSMTIEKVNGNEGTVAGTLLNGAAGATFGANDTPNTVTFNTSTLSSDDLIDNGTTVYYVVKATVVKDTTTDNDDYVKVSFDALNSSQIVYSADSAISGLADVTDLRIGVTKLDGTQINE